MLVLFCNFHSFKEFARQHSHSIIHNDRHSPLFRLPATCSAVVLLMLFLLQR